MSSIKIIVEGGGDTNASGRAELRVAFDTLIGAQKEAARKKRMKWDTSFCGCRGEAAKEFANALNRKSADVIVLLVDAEDEVRSEMPSCPTPAERVKHLLDRDKWNRELSEANPEHVHLMTQCMEAWVFADVEKVAEFYGQGFKKAALPKRKQLDAEPKNILYSCIEKATKDTTKKAYGKIKHASDLLKTARPTKVAERCISFQQFTQWIDKVIDAA